MSIPEGLSWAREAFVNSTEVGSAIIGIDGIDGSVRASLVSLSGGTEYSEAPLA